MMRKILYGVLAVCLLAPTSLQAAGADYDTLSEMAATVTASDFIPIFDASEADGSRMKKRSFDGTATNCLTGSGTFAAFVGDEVDPNALLTAGTDNVKDTHIDWGSGAGQVGYADVVAQWASGSCTGFLYSDGTCSTPSGGVDTTGTPAAGQIAIFSDADTIGGQTVAAFFVALDDVTIGAAAGTSKTWTFDTGAGTDPAMTVSDNAFTFNKPVAATGVTIPGTAAGGQYMTVLEDTDLGTSASGWGIYGNLAHATVFAIPLAAPTAGQVMAFAVPGDQTMSDGTTKSVSVGTFITPIVSADIDTFAELDAIVADKALVNKADGAVWLGVHDFGGSTTVEIPNSDDPDLGAVGQVALDTDGWLRVYNGSIQYGKPLLETIHVTVIAPNDLADAARDAFVVWKNTSGMNFVITHWYAESGTDNTTLNIETTDATGGTNATVDAVEIATDGTAIYTADDGTITAATIADGSRLLLDFDDTDAPTYVKISIVGYYDGNVN